MSKILDGVRAFMRNVRNPRVEYNIEPYKKCLCNINKINFGSLDDKTLKDMSLGFVERVGRVLLLMIFL